MEEKLTTLMLKLEGTPPLDDGNSNNSSYDTCDDEKSRRHKKQFDVNSQNPSFLSARNDVVKIILTT